jgi:hypothetical protein
VIPTPAPDGGSDGNVGHRVPITGFMVQGGFAKDSSGGRADTYEPSTSLVCRQVHFLNPQTAKVRDRGPLETAS